MAFHAGRWEQAEALSDTVYDVLGRCDVLVSNAGMSPVDDNVSAVTEQRLRSGVEDLPYAMAEAGLNALARALAGGVGAEGPREPGLSGAGHIMASAGRSRPLARPVQDPSEPARPGPVISGRSRVVRIPGAAATTAGTALTTRMAVATRPAWLWSPLSLDRQRSSA